jgi:GxxExxY protein
MDPGTRTNLVAFDLTRTILTAFHDTYRELGPGFPEFVARRALGIAIRDAGLSAFEEVELPVWFRNKRIATFRADLLVSETVLVEVKVADSLQSFHQAQLLHYLKASGLEVGLLVNFGREPQVKRMVNQLAKLRDQARRVSGGETVDMPDSTAATDDAHDD